MGRSRRKAALPDALRELGEAGLPEGYPDYWYGGGTVKNVLQPFIDIGYIETNSGCVRLPSECAEKKRKWIEEEFPEGESWSVASELSDIDGLMPEEYEVRIEPGERHVFYHIFLGGSILSQGYYDYGQEKEGAAKAGRSVGMLLHRTRAAAREAVARQRRVAEMVPEGNEKMILELGRSLLEGRNDHPLLSVVPEEYSFEGEEDEEGLAWSLLDPSGDGVASGWAGDRYLARQQSREAADAAARGAWEELFGG